MALEHTKMLLRGRSRTSLPQLQQRMGKALQSELEAAQLPRCSLAAAEEAQRLIEGSPSAKAKETYLAFLKRKVCRSKKTGAEGDVKLPIVACVGALLSAIFMSYGAVGAMVTSFTVIDLGQNAVNSLFEIQEKAVNATNDFSRSTDMAWDAWQEVLQVRQSLVSAVDSLDPVIQQIRQEDPAAAAHLEAILGNVTSFLASSEASSNLDTVTWMLQEAKSSAQSIAGMAVSLIELLTLIPDGLQLILDMLSTTTAVAFFVAVAVSSLSIHFMLWRLNKDRTDLLQGDKHMMPKSGTSAFHPVRASTLPGMMMSSVFFGFCLCFIMTFIGFLAIWLLIKLMFFSPELVFTFLQMGSGIGVSFAVKSLVLDKFIGRRLLTQRDFVTHWKLFNFYTLFTIPISTASATLLAVFRLAFLVAIACLYVVRLDTTLFPDILVGMDSGFCGYMSAMLVTHRHQNPVWQSLVQVEAERLRSSEKESSPRRRAISRWSLATTLVNNPGLIKERRFHKQQETEEHSLLDTINIKIEQATAPGKDQQRVISKE
mmetsp:Transcript_84309/g.149007  ORF Transcript_84309/g.149007 Transcript_84309/m.149007 type:complete len:542 (-) Transcript_84309:130-1755(-)